MHYYDHYHDPNAHLRLNRQREDELLRPAKRREIRPGLLARLCALLHGAVPARPASEQVTTLSAARDAIQRDRLHRPPDHRAVAQRFLAREVDELEEEVAVEAQATEASGGSGERLCRT